MVKCPTCGAHVPKSISIEVPVGDHFEQYCSLRCAIAADRVPATAPPKQPDRILVAVDGSGPSLRATEIATTLALASGASVALIHAIDPSLLRTLPVRTEAGGVQRLGIDADELEERLRSDAEALLDRCRRVCEAAGVKVESSVEIEAPARAIANAAKRFDMVVIGSRGLGARSAEVLGSLSHRVIADSSTPVLVVH